MDTLLPNQSMRKKHPVVGLFHDVILVFKNFASSEWDKDVRFFSWELIMFP